MLFAALATLGLSSPQTLNLSTFVRGSWNATTHFLKTGGEIIDNHEVLYIDFAADGNSSFIGRLRGYAGDFEVRITIDSRNPQVFTIEKVRDNDDEAVLLAHAEMRYGKRNLPHAHGQWKDDSMHFKVVVFSPFHAELTIFGKDEDGVRVFRFEKTPVPQEPSILGALLPPLVIGGIIIAHRLWDMHNYICEREKAEKEAEERAKNAKAAEKKEE